MDRKWWVLLAVGVGTLMSAIDTSVVNIILPVVTAALKSDVATIEWVVTIYLLVVSGLLLSFGRLGDMRGHKSLYLSGFIIFVIGSALSGAAISPTMLIACRALQAIGAAILYANSPAILTKSFPPEQRGQALGMQAAMTYLGLTIGPSLGGWLADQLSWRAVFYINVPVGLLALWLSIRFIPRDSVTTHAEPFDKAGAALFTGGLVSLLSALNQGSEWGWTSLPVLALMLLAAGLLTLFVQVELRVTSPMLDLSLFRNRLFSAATLSAVLNYAALYSIVFLLPFYLEQGRGLDTATAGLVLTAQPLLMAVTAPLSGTLSDRIGSRLPGTLGMGILTAALLMLSRLSADTPLSSVALALALAGLGIGIFVSPNNSALLGAAPRNRQGIASGVLATARNVGMVMGVGLAGAIFTTVLPNASAASNSPLLFNAVDAGFLAAAGLSLLGVFTSAVRGEGAPRERAPTPG